MVVNIYCDYLLVTRSLTPILMHSCVTRAHSPAGRLVLADDWGPGPSGERLIFMVTDGDAGWSHPGSPHYHNISQNNVRSRDQSPILYIPQTIWSHSRVVCCMVILSQHDFPRAKLPWLKAQLTPKPITTLFSQISHGKSSFNQNMLIFVADPNHGIMKCGLMDKMSVPRVLSTAKWPLLCNKEHIKLAGHGGLPSYLLALFIILYRSICTDTSQFMVTAPNIGPHIGIIMMMVLLK